MGRYRKVEVRIWNDAKFRTLSDDAKLTFLFLLTHPHLTALGAMRASEPGLAAELGWGTAKFSKAFRQVLGTGMVRHDEDAAFLAFPKFLKHNPPQSPNVVKSWANADDFIPECPLKAKLYQHVKAFAEGLGESFQIALPEVFRKPFGNRKQEQEQEQEQEEQPLSRSPLATDDVDAVIAHYQTLHPRAKPGPVERRLITARMKEGYSVENLIAAIDGNHRDPHCCGQNERGKKFHRLELILRDSSHVSDYMEIPLNGAAPRSKRTNVNQSALNEWAKMQEGTDGQEQGTDGSGGRAALRDVPPGGEPIDDRGLLPSPSEPDA